MASLTISKPFTLAVPDVGFKMVQSIEIVVVFPAPFGPSNPKISPDSTLMSNELTALSPLNDFVSLKVSIALLIEFLSWIAELEILINNYLSVFHPMLHVSRTSKKI
jgi:hypothetical protein